MNKKHLALAGRIHADLVEIGKIVGRVRTGWERAKQSGDDYYLDSVALNLHGFYSAVEKIFEQIAVVLDQTKPEGRNWHQDLLRQMGVEIKLVRPPVISAKTRDSLDEFCGFRHVVRNVYTFQISPLKIEPLVNNLPDTFEHLKKEIGEFLSFLEARNKNNTAKKK